MSNKIDLKGPRANLLYTTNSQKVLFYFLSHPKEQIYDREVSRKAAISRAGANFALRELANAGLLTKEKKGRMLFYALNEREPATRQLKILQNIVLLTPLLRNIQNQVIRATFFGSASKGENLEESDRDLFILTHNKKEIEKKTHKYVVSLHLQPVIHTPQEWAKIERENKVFANKVAEGIILIQSHES